MKNQRKIASGLGAFLMSFAAFADGILTEPSRFMGWHPVISAGGGVAISKDVGKSNYFPVIEPGVSQFYRYTNQPATQTEGLFEVFVGGEHALFENWLIQPGVAFTQAGTYQVHGTLTQGLDLQSESQFRYSYNVITRQVLAQAKLLHPYNQKYYPYLLAGIGSSFNAGKAYYMDMPAGLLSTRSYANKTSSTFSYRVGAGLDMDLVSNTRLGLAYRFSALGNVGLGNASIDGVPVSGSIAQPNMYASEILAQLTYIM